MSGSIKYTDAILDKKLLASQKQLSSIGISYPFRYFFKFLKPPSIGHKIAFICPGDGESKCSKTLLNFYQTIWHHILTPQQGSAKNFQHYLSSKAFGTL